MSDAGSIGAALVIFAFTVYKCGVLRRVPPNRKPAIRSICAAGLFGGIAFLFSSPLAAVTFDRLVGVPNLSIMLRNIAGTAGQCALYVMILYWRYPRDRAWRGVRRAMVGYGLVVATLILLAALSPKVAERSVTEFPTAFARMPFLREFVVLYFLVWAFTAFVVVILCVRFAVENPGGQRWMRTGFCLLAVGFSLIMTCHVIVLMAVVAQWYGVDLVYWSVTVAPVFLNAGGVIGAGGVILVPAGPRLEAAKEWSVRYRASLRDYRTLRPLWLALRTVDPAMVHAPAFPWEWFNCESRLFWRVIEINDWLHQMGAYHDIAVADSAIARSLDSGVGGANPTAVAEAVRIRMALLKRGRGDVATQALENAQLRDGPSEHAKVFIDECAQLVAIARVFTSPRVDKIVREASTVVLRS
ncbi:MAG: hypothetical protein JOZ47_10610 [Kutzneria sp.]|nr:hypothetical protein [Kutzneria sp.]MBV9845511.1 hypothetical protein [Kutzneria sp.]